MVRVLVTGASGMLGRAVMLELGTMEGVELEGWSFSRQGPALKSVDLTDPDLVDKAFKEFKPEIVIHCAAERKPDNIGKDPGKAATLNAAATALLAQLLAESSVASPLFLYISTDYVFDGASPPYAEDAEPKPLNEYGLLKLQGEVKTEKRSKSWAILRVPILYGPVEFIGEGAVDVLVKTLRQDAPVLVDNVQRRFPTHTAHVAQAITFLLKNHIQTAGSVSGIYHFSGSEEMSKYEMVLGMGAVLDLPTSHIQPNDQEPPETPDTVQRPKNAQLQNNRLRDLGFTPPQPRFAQDVKDLYSCFLLAE